MELKSAENLALALVNIGITFVSGGSDLDLVFADRNLEGHEVLSKTLLSKGGTVERLPVPLVHVVVDRFDGRRGDNTAISVFLGLLKLVVVIFRNRHLSLGEQALIETMEATGKVLRGGGTST
jgi:hypothetical protein